MHLVAQGLLIAASPLILAWLYGLISRTSMWDEASGGGGFLWLLMLSVPLALVWVLFRTLLSLSRLAFRRP